MLNDLNLFGPPAILLYDSNSNEMSNIRVFGEMYQAGH